jgi:hypothetical protein
VAKVDKSALHDFSTGEIVTDTMLDQNFEVLRTALNDLVDSLTTQISNAGLGVQTGGVISDRSGANPHWTLKQGGVNTWDWELDASGNLLLNVWNGSGWTNLAQFSKANGIMSLTKFIVNGATCYGRLANSSSITAPVGGDFYFDTTQNNWMYYTGSVWTTFGLSAAQVRIEALKSGGA